MGKRVLAGSLQPCKSFLVRCVLGAERWEPLPAAPCCHSIPGLVSALLVESQSHQPLNPRAGWGQVQHTLPLQKLQSGMHCSIGSAWLPKDNHTASSCIGHCWRVALAGLTGLPSPLHPAPASCQAHAGNGPTLPCRKAAPPLNCKARYLQHILEKSLHLTSRGVTSKLGTQVTG